MYTYQCPYGKICSVPNCCYNKNVQWTEAVRLYVSPKKRFSTEEAIEIGKTLNIPFDKFNVEQFRMGLDIELEHGRINMFTNITNDDPLTTGKITLAHLNEFPDYYTRLYKLEKDAEDYWEKNNE